MSDQSVSIHEIHHSLPFQVVPEAVFYSGTSIASTINVLSFAVVVIDEELLGFGTLHLDPVPDWHQPGVYEVGLCRSFVQGRCSPRTHT